MAWTPEDTKNLALGMERASATLFQNSMTIEKIKKDRETSALDFKIKKLQLNKAEQEGLLAPEKAKFEMEELKTNKKLDELKIDKALAEIKGLNLKNENVLKIGDSLWPKVTSGEVDIKDVSLSSSGSPYVKMSSLSNTFSKSKEKLQTLAYDIKQGKLPIKETSGTITKEIPKDINRENLEKYAVQKGIDLNSSEFQSIYNALPENNAPAQDSNRIDAVIPTENLPFSEVFSDKFKTGIKDIKGSISKGMGVIDETSLNERRFMYNKLRGQGMSVQEAKAKVGL